MTWCVLIRDVPIRSQWLSVGADQGILKWLLSATLSMNLSLILCFMSAVTLAKLSYTAMQRMQSSSTLRLSSTLLSYLSTQRYFTLSAITKHLISVVKKSPNFSIPTFCYLFRTFFTRHKIKPHSTLPSPPSLQPPAYQSVTSRGIVHLCHVRVHALDWRKNN